MSRIDGKSGGCRSNFRGTGTSKHSPGGSKGGNNDDDIRGSPGKICQWCGRFMKAHGDYWWSDWTDHWEISLKGGKGYFYEQIICPDCAKAVLELKKKRKKVKQPGVAG